MVTVTCLFSSPVAVLIDIVYTVFWNFDGNFIGIRRYESSTALSNQRQCLEL